MSDEQISPELALVCPELRANAIAALPDPWSASQFRSNDGPIGRAHPVLADQAASQARASASVARAICVYFLTRATELLTVMIGVALFVLLLAVIGAAVRG